MSKKKIPQHEQLEARKDAINERLTRVVRSAEEEAERIIKEFPPEKEEPAIGDIVQIITKGHRFTARIGIVHHVDGVELVCYQPGKNGVPVKFKVDTRDVIVVGKAHLKYGKPLPDDDVSKTNLDQI